MTTLQRRSGPTPKDRRFVEFLKSLEAKQDRGALADLRRGLGRPPGTAMEMHRHVARWLPSDGPQNREDSYFLVASLFAAHRLSWPGEPDGDGWTNLGASFRRLADAASQESVERRFTALLASEREEMPERLRHAISLLKSRDVPVDWAWLLHDLQQWGYHDRRVQRRWARAFWGTSTKAGETDGAAEDIENRATPEASNED